MNLAAQTTPLVAALEQLGPHDHLCSIYESPQEHYAVAVPFIRIGLDRGEKCIYIADDGTVDGTNFWELTKPRVRWRVC